MAEIDDIFEPETKNATSFNKAEWIKQQKETRTRAYEMLEDATQEIRNPDIFMSYLDVQSRFDRYSVSNALLVAYQMPEATRLCDSKTWKEHDVFIKKGESGIIILEPGKEYKREDGSIRTSYNAKKVFDVSQTTAKQYSKTQRSYNEKLLVKALVKTSPVPIEISSALPIEASAVYQSDRKRILVRQGMPGDEILRSLSREIAHARIDKGDYSRENCSLAAYGISFMVCRRIGVEPYPISDKDELFKDVKPKDVRKQLGEMRTEANSMVSTIEKTLEAKNINKDAR